ncbi:putative adenylyl cyclase-associated protein [Diaporthe ampelina]|uniref:Adenylyl cyclase-associated protein n=1 Tax=Diaporthe ampelina TaxID=1214573 RepID=A0A0G2FTN4_9PEZI|nr:putative adenylyl cyclase-associated protein [Diaporthe ampelina]
MAPVVVSSDTNQRVTNLLHRLEAATSRLEDIASSTIEIPQAVPALKETLASPDASSKTISDTASRAPSAPAHRAPAAADEPLPDSIEDFDAFLKTSVQNYSNISKAIGGLIAEQAAKVVHGFQEERKFLLITTKAKKPNMSNSDDMEAYQKLLKPINESLMAVVNIKESNRGSPASNELSAVADGIMMLAWVTDEGKPHKHVDNTLGSAQYYGNRVIKDNKDKNPQQVEWIQSFHQIFKDLSEYIKQYFPSGIPWNAQGEPVQEVVKAASTSTAPASAPAPPPPAAGGPPPPPPPGPPPVLQINEKKAAPKPAAGGLDAVFSELNKGEAVTAGLRKVDRSEMTHKNPSLRASSTVSDASRGKSPAPGKKPKPESMRAKKPPIKTFEGNKWTIENFEKEAKPIEIEASLSHSILISRCNNATIIVKGKANAVTIDNTNRLNLIVDTLVSSVDVVKSQNFALQVLGTIPTVMLDSVDGAQVYFSKESTASRIIHSKSAGINLNVISGPDDDYVEVPLPGQISSYYDPEKRTLVDEIVSHAG